MLQQKEHVASDRKAMATAYACCVHYAAAAAAATAAAFVKLQ
jgi:hypothetical protein